MLSSENSKLNYYYQNIDSNSPIIVFLPGYNSNIQSTKALFLKDYCAHQKLSFLTLDYRGHGESSGNLLEFTVQDWLQDVTTVLQTLTSPNRLKILIGSSMGGWLATLYALNNPKETHSIIGIAPAIDFTKSLNDRPEEFLNPLNNNTFALKNSPATVISKKLITSGNSILLLKNKIELNLPVRLLHGEKDTVVPKSVSENFAKQLTSKDVECYFIKNGDHRLSTPQNLQLLAITINSLLTINKL